MDKRYMIIHDGIDILDASEFIEGIGIYMPEGRAIVIDTKPKIKTLLTGIGISDYSKLDILGG